MDVSIWDSINTSLTTTAGSTSASVSSATGLAAGAAINSVNVPPGTTVGVLSGTNVTLAIPPITIPARTRTGTTLVDIPPNINTSTLVGATVTGPRIPANTVVSSVLRASVASTGPNDPGTTGQLVLSNAATGPSPFTGTTDQYTFTRTGNAITVTGADTAAIFTGAGVSYSGSVQLERSFDGGSTWLVCNIGGAGILAVYNTGTPVGLSFGEPEKNVLYRFNCTSYVSGTINYRISQTGSVNETLSMPLI